MRNNTRGGALRLIGKQQGANVAGRMMGRGQTGPIATADRTLAAANKRLAGMPGAMQRQGVMQPQRFAKGGKIVSPTKRFIVKYKGSEGGGPEMNWHTYAYDAEHAGDKFYEGSPDDEGWEIVSIDRPKDPRGKIDTKFDRPKN